MQMVGAVFKWLVLFSLCIANINGYLTNSTFKRYTFLAGYDCAPTDLVISTSAVRSRSECMATCSQQDDCLSLFYVVQNGVPLCQGCNANYTSTDSGILPALTGSSYYKIEEEAGGNGTCDWCDFTFENSGYKVTTTMGTFPFGKSLCAGMGGYPNIVETDAEATFIISELKILDPGNTWVGLYRAKAATEYVWNATGAVAMATWYPYSGNEPHHDNSDENCIMYYPGMQYKWVDVINRCLYDTSFMLCEVDL